MAKKRARRITVRLGVLLTLVCAAVSPMLVGTAEAADTCTTTSGLTTCIFNYTGAEQSWIIPAGVTQVTLDVFGAQGGFDAAEGGKGGRATATIAVTPGETLTIMVGGQGHSPFLGEDALGGFNGGGNGGAAYNLPVFFYGSGGGGASDVRIGGVDLAHRVIVAGGGGGAANVFGPDGPSFGGAGGGLTGGTGNSAHIPSAPTGGAGGNQDGTSGSGLLGTGSNGIDSTSNVLNGVGAGGGGGGYYGGAGGFPSTGGGGGSGFGPAGTVFETGVRSGNGQIVLTYTPPDSTPPTTTIALSPASPDGSNGWYVHEPTVTISAVDNADGSGVAETRCVLDPASVPGTFDDLPSTACPYLGAGAAVADGAHTVYAASIDNAGNAESPLQSVSFQVDTTPPTLSPSLAEGTVFTVGALVPIVNPNASDTLSGVASQSCGPVDTASVGTKSVSCTATDNAGNTTTVETGYAVTFGICPLFDQSKGHKSGSTIPIKLQLCDASQANVSSSNLTVTAIDLNGNVDLLNMSGNANPNNVFRYDETLGGYILNLQTTGLASGTHTLNFSVNGDPVTHSVQFVIR